MLARKKIVVLGALGMAGHIVCDYLVATEEYEVLAVARQSGRNVSKILDVTDFNALTSYLETAKADYVVNCVGVLVSQSQNDIAKAILINSYLPHLLANLGRGLNYKLIQISTDCVFSGKIGQYQEDSFRDADDNYGRSKALGEVMNGNDVTIRTSIIGPELKDNGTGLFHWFMNQSESINGFTKAIWSGVTTLELAKAVKWVIEENITDLYHLTNGQGICKYDLLNLFKKYTHRTIKINAIADYVVDKSLVDTRKEINYRIPSYQEMVKEMLSVMQISATSYKHYDL